MTELQLLKQGDSKAAAELLKRFLAVAKKNSDDREPTITTIGMGILTEAYDRMVKEAAREDALTGPFRIDRDDPEGRFLLEEVIEMEDYADIAAQPGSASREQLELVAGCYTWIFHDLREVLGMED